MSIDAYYPTHWLKCNPIHEVRDWCYVRRLVRAARRGEVIPPVLIDGRIGGGNMLTGTHRAAANDLMMRLGGEPLIDVVSIDDIDVPDSLQDAINNLDYEAIDDLAKGLLA